MTEPVTFTIHGKPVAKQRPRHGKFTTYTPKETVSFEAHVGSVALPLFDQPLTGPVKVAIWATFKPAVSWSKKKTAAHLGRYHTQKPDLDNIEKAILDGLNRIAFRDDSQVAEVQKRKIWGPDAKTVVTVEALT